MTHSNKDDEKKKSKSSKKEQRPAFISKVDDVESDINKELKENVDLNPDGEDIPLDEDMTDGEIRSLLINLAKTEINENRNLYRCIVINNLSNSHENWDDDISDYEKIQRIDDIIDTSVQIWATNHIDRFIEQVNEDEEEGIKIRDIIKASVAAEVVRSVIADVSAEAIYNQGRDVTEGAVDWLTDVAEIPPEDLLSAINAMLRALFGV